MKKWYHDPKHGENFKGIRDSFAEEFKTDDDVKVKKRAFKWAVAPGEPKPKAAKRVQVDMAGLNLKPISEGPKDPVIADVNLLNIPDCKLVITNGSTFVKHAGDKEVGFPNPHQKPSNQRLNLIVGTMLSKDRSSISRWFKLSWIDLTSSESNCPDLQ